MEGTLAVSTYLAIDFGAESGRAILGKLSNGRLELVERHRFANPTLVDAAGCLRWDIQAQWQEVCTGIRRAAEATGGRLTGIAVDSWGVDIALLAADGQNVVAQPRHYRSFLDGSDLARVESRALSGREVFARTGIQPLPFNTIYQLAKLADDAFWRSQESNGVGVHFMPDAFTRMLCGRAVAERTVASTGALLDVTTGGWATDLLHSVDMRDAALPQLVDPATIVERLRPELAESCGVQADCPVIATAGLDTAAAIVAVPASAETSWCFISSGTWSLIDVERHAPVLSESARIAGFTNEAGAAGTYRVLKNIAGLWVLQECRRAWQAAGHEYTYPQLMAMAADATSDSAVDLASPQFLEPGSMPAKIDAFCRAARQEPPTSLGDTVRICLNSLAIAYRRAVAEIEAITGTRIDVIHVVGGGSQNTLLNQMTADACARLVIAGPAEATAAGNVLVQAIACGEVESLAAARAIVAASFTLTVYEPRDVYRMAAIESRLAWFDPPEEPTL